MRVKFKRKVGVIMSHTPYGYKIENGHAVINEPVAVKVKQLFEEFLNCGSMRAAAIKVGIDKTHSVIGRLLKNEVYLGDDYYPQLIDEDIFYKVQKLRNKNAIEQNRIREYENQMPPAEATRFQIKKVTKQFEDPYKQAEYVYGLIEEEKHE